TISQSIQEVKEWVKLNQPDRHMLIVKKEDGDLAGTLKLKDLHNSDLPDDNGIESLVDRKKIYIYPESRISFAVEMMDRYHTDLIPVFRADQEPQSIALLTPRLVFAPYRKARNADNHAHRSINLQRSSYRMLVKSKQFYR